MFSKFQVTKSEFKSKEVLLVFPVILEKNWRVAKVFVNCVWKEKTSRYDSFSRVSHRVIDITIIHGENSLTCSMKDQILLRNIVSDRTINAFHIAGVWQSKIRREI